MLYYYHLDDNSLKMFLIEHNYIVSYILRNSKKTYGLLCKFKNLFKDSPETESFTIYSLMQRYKHSCKYICNGTVEIDSIDDYTDLIKDICLKLVNINHKINYIVLYADTMQLSVYDKAIKLDIKRLVSSLQTLVSKLLPGTEVSYYLGI